MKIKVDWKTLLKQILNALKPVIIGAVGGGIVSVTTTGCSSLTPTSKGQSLTVMGIGIPAVAIMTSTKVDADNSGSDTNVPAQVNPVTTKPTIGL